GRRRPAGRRAMAGRRRWARMVRRRSARQLYAVCRPRRLAGNGALFPRAMSAGFGEGPHVVLRRRAERGVSKDAPKGASETASWTILRDAMLRIAPQNEVG